MSKNGKKKSGKYHHGNLQQALVSNSIDILEKEGVDALSLRRIAREAGVSEAAPYSHFKNKKDLLTAVCVQGTVWFGQYMKRESAGKSRADYLVGLAMGYVHFALDHPALFHLMSTRNASEAMDEQGKVPEIFFEGYQMMAKGLADSPLHHFGLKQQQLDIPLAWGQVHGITNLLLERRIKPEDYGFDELESFIKAVMDRFLQNDALSRLNAGSDKTVEKACR
jgi:AcrR family transcriptional regulator